MSPWFLRPGHIRATYTRRTPERCLQGACRRQEFCVERLQNHSEAHVGYLSFWHCLPSLSHSWPWRTLCTQCRCSSSSMRSSRPSRRSWGSKASSPLWKQWTQRLSPSCRSFCRDSKSTWAVWPPSPSDISWLAQPAICMWEPAEMKSFV